MNSRNLFLFKVLFVIMICAAKAFAQNQPENELTANVEQIQSLKAEKFDEFGRINECAKGAKLDSLAVSLQNDSTKTAYIIFYQTKVALPSQFESGDTYASKYLINVRGVDSNRVTAIFGGFRENQTTELWLLPKGAEIPKPSNTIAPPTLPENKTYLYDRKEIELYDLDDLFLPQVFAEMKKADEEMIAEIALPVQIRDSTEKQDSIVSAEEQEISRFGWANESFARQVKKTKDAHGTIIFYADDSTLDISKTHYFFQQGAEKIAKAAGLNVEKIQVVFGGYSNYAMRVEMFVVPKNGDAPIATPEERLVETESEEAETENPK